MLTREGDTFTASGTVLVPGDAQVVFNIPANIIRFGKVSYPAEYGFVDGPNNYLIGDAGDTDSDVSLVMRVEGNARWEAGMVGDVTDGVHNQSFHIKSVTGDYLSEVFSDRLVISDDRNPRYPFIDIYGPPGEYARLRLHGQSGEIPMLVIGNSNGEVSPTGTGAGLEISFDLNSDIARFTSITHDAFYRDMSFEAQHIRFSTGPVFLNFDALVLNPQGAMLIGHPIQKASEAFISNAGDGGIGLMSGYTIGQVLTALGGTGTPPTFTVDQLQVASAAINSPGSGGTNGSQVFAVATGATGTQPQFNGTVTGGALASIDSWVTHGDLTTDPPSLTGRAITGAGLVGGTVDVAMGAVGQPTLLSEGTLTDVPLTPTATSSSGPGVGATLFIQYQNSAGTINVELGVIDDGTWPTGSAGSGYVRAFGPSLSGPLSVVSTLSSRGARPVSTATAGWSVTSNYSGTVVGAGAVDFWNTVDATGGYHQGFAFWQKLSGSTEQNLAYIYGNGTFTEIDVNGTPSTTTFLYNDAAESAIGASAGLFNVYSDGSLAATFDTSQGLALQGSLTVKSATLISSSVTLTNGAAAQAGTLTNAPAAGNPTKWIPVVDNGVTRHIPAW